MLWLKIFNTPITITATSRQHTLPKFNRLVIDFTLSTSRARHCKNCEKPTEHATAEEVTGVSFVLGYLERQMTLVCAALYYWQICYDRFLLLGNAKARNMGFCEDISGCLFCAL